MKYLFLLLLLASCGQNMPTQSNSSNNGPVKIQPVGDPIFDPMVENFMLLSEHYLGSVSYPRVEINFGPTTGVQNEVADCVKSDPRQVTVNKDAWDHFDSMTRESLIFHELGHCLLNRDHVLTKRQDGTPTSLMYPDLVKSAAYLSHLESYRKELFTGVQ